MKKRVLAAIMTATLALSLAGCGGFLEEILNHQDHQTVP